MLILKRGRPVLLEYVTDPYNVRKSLEKNLSGEKFMEKTLSRLDEAVSTTLCRERGGDQLRKKK